MIDPDKKKKKDAIDILRMTKRSGAYVKNAAGNGITRAGRAEQKAFKKDIKSKIRQVKRS